MRVDLFHPLFDLSTYTRTASKLREIAFPLGGIGTGCVSLDGRGALVDWEIFGRPNKGCVLENTFPALWFQEEGGAPRTLRLLGPRLKNWMGEAMEDWNYGHGRFFRAMDGLPCFDSVTFTGTFPVARVEFEKADIPLKVELAAMNPFIPLDVEASSFPGALLVYRLTNVSDRPVSAAVAWSMMNPIGVMDPTSKDQDGFINEPFQVDGASGVSFSSSRYGAGEMPFGDAALVTDWPDVDLCERWSLEGWWDSVRTFWNYFKTEGRVKNFGKEGDSRRVPGSLSCRASLQPGESVEIPFVFAWRFPNSEKYWAPPDEQVPLGIEHYATVWPSAREAGAELLRRRQELVGRTLAFETALYDTTLPHAVIDSVGSTLSVLHTPTLKRLEDGSFWAWEGCSAISGCCEGTCSHVWNYALAHAFLFPGIQRSFLDTAFAHAFRCGPPGEDGAMNFRIPLPLGVELPLWHAASDGQLGQIVQTYRDWRLTGDEAWLRSIYPSAKRALGYALKYWDRDLDGLVETDMHNTYDINFCTPNPLTQFFYLASLRATQAMADEVGDTAFSTRCADLLEKGTAKTQSLWNGEFYRQLENFEDPESPRYQHGQGCLSDQLFGQLSATVAGLGDLVPKEQIQKAVEAIHRYNFRAPLGDHENLQRVYAMGDESGLVLCSWPKGEIPAYPFPYSDEVWTGIEYQVATHLAYVGHRDEAVEIVAAIRERHDGERRNPWNEFECGSHYARALASYGLVLAWTGMLYDAVAKSLEFSPEPFKGFWSVPGAWGTAERPSYGGLKVDVIEGTLPEGTTIGA